jgi:amino acid adenylation domain-containing protein
VLLEVNDTSEPDLSWTLLHEGFQRQAGRTPDAVALIDGERRLTYQELYARASELAGQLRRMGIGPETVVGVRLPRTAELIVTLLGVLEAGAAYLPLDPAYPEERIGFMVEDAGAALVIESPALPSPPGPLSRHPSPPPRERGRDLAYLIYTSGSTGRPKGVAIEHASAVRLIAWASQAFSAAELRGVLASTSISFDLSIFEIFVPLSLGGTVILAENALALPGLPARDEVTLINTVPSAVAALLDTEGLPESVRTVNLAGEPLRRSLADKVLATGVRLWDLYGPSEDTTYSTGFLIEPGQPEEPLIGWPMAGSRAYVVDRGGRPLPLGVPGELWLGGGGLARGYLGRPALTAEKFIPDPFGETPGGRVYRTGDLVRRRFDGALDYLGRIDHQVKIRGFRIELGEVEAALLAVPFVREAVVVARDGALIGYVALTGDAPDRSERGPEEALRESLRQRLPAVFVPAVLIVLEALPRTPNGKVDRKALPEPERLRGTSAEPPSGPVEETLATLWEGLLGRSGIGRTDRFFDLGGHSLLASRVASRVREAFGVELPLAAFFEEPTLAGLARRIERARGADPALAEPIPRVSREAPLPLSFAQQRLWFLDRLEPWSATYNMPVALRLRGEIDKAALERALTEIVRRHEALRTTFHEAEGGPVQRVTPPGPFSLPVEDAGAAAFQRLEEEAVRPFDLENGPVFRALLLRIADRDHLLLANLHHIVSDGWSLGVLVRELSVLYAAFREDRPSALAELPLQSADWASWQRLRLAGGPLETGLAWWREALRGLPERLDLPVDRPQRPVERRRGGRIPVRLDPGLTRDLADLGRREGVTLFTVLLAGFQALLGRWSGQEDLAVGSPVAGRTRVEIEELIGFFVNTLVLRADLSGEPEIRELLRRSRSMLLAAHEHQHVPFEKLVEELAPVRELGRTPLFEAMLSFQNGAPEPPRLPGLETELVPVGTATAKLDLEIQLAERGGALEGTVEYDADLFETATIDRFLDHFVLLLRGMVEAPAARVADLPLLAEAERGQLLRWNATTVERPAEASLPALFAAQADRTPERVAVRFEGNELTYGELDERSNRLAWHLRGRGVGPDVVVGVALERSLELIVALYAVHKAGGAFLPLDLSHPDERLGRMLADSGAAVVVTVERYRERFVDFRTLCLDTDSSSLAAAPSTRPPLEIQGDHLAYVIFTSGSTGAPKGAMNTHAAIANRLLWMQETYRLEAADRVLQKTPATFDVSVWEFFWPLLVGARLVVARPDGHRDPTYLLRTVVDEGITVLHFVPSMLQIFLEEPGAERAAGVRQVLASGEALSEELARRFFERLPGARLHNLYGPTEAAVDVTAWTCEPGAVGAGVPIGRPIANIQIRILDRGLRLVPAGSPGELCIAGAGLARGYLGRADLTAERFVPDPGSAGLGERLYRTGDLARWRPDGALDYLGRIDHQVKIRGVRIEPGEIEAALAAFPAVRDGVVLAREDRPGDRRLVAYVVPRGGELRVEELRDFLRQRLPEALVPAAFVELDALPLSANGKLDRKALARIAPPAMEPEAFEPPAGLVEERLAAIWSEVLGVGRIGRRDGFFERGGHSLLAAQVVTRIRRAFGVEIPLRALFEAPTLAGIAGRIAAAEEGSAESPLSGIAGDGPSPLSFAQQRLWFLAQLDPASSVYNIPAALQLRGALDAHALRRALIGIVRRHETLRTTFRLEGAEPRQVIGEVGDVPLPLIDLRGLGPDAEAARLAMAEAARPFDLQAGPVFRALLLRLSGDRHRLLVNMHHIASDGWSLGVFTRELAALYANTPLPELPVRYRDFAVWQRTRRSDESDLAFWREELRGLPAGLDLPADHPRPPVQTYRGAVRPFAVGGETTEGLRRLARGTGVTLFMALLAGFQALLARWSGQEDLAVGTPVAGRSRVELEGLIGFFVNTLVVRCDLSGDPDSRTLVRRARERFLTAQAHQDLPFEKLVEELKPERNLARPPLFQVLLVLQNTPRTPLVLPGLEVTSEAVETGTAKFELQLTLEERDGGLAGTLDYNRDLFEAPTMDRFLGHLGALLAAAVAEPERPAGELPILSEAERSQLVAWNATAVRYPEGATLPALFAVQVDRTPENVAVRFEGESLTYGELDERSSRHAWHLRRLGVGPDVVVAVALERSLELIVALYAVHKAGGAYLPLDLSHPDERLGRMVGDSGAAVVVTLERDAPRFAGPHVLCLDADHAAISAESPTRPPLAIHGDHLAYVIFTSGSTGAPKGATNTHAAIANRLLWMQDAYRLDGSDRVLQKTPSTFDVSVWEFFWPLLTGARLVVARPEGHRDPSYLLRTITEEGITVLHFVPSMLQVFLEEPGVERAGCVRQVMASGEALPADLARRFFERLPGARLHNLYGPTEAAVDVTSWTCEPGSTEAVIPIGRPIANLEIRILDRLARPLPMGAPGELCIGGAGLARGYLGRPDLTADRFIPDPERSGDRLYRTGDLARWRADGWLEYLGRIDHQVKIRGMRIEPGEIESALASFPAVREAVVLAREDRPGHKMLVAYLVPRDGSLLLDELRGLLRERLPEPLVPSAFVLLDALPLSANGKLDRRSLPAPEGGPAAAPAVLPRTGTEEAIAAAWREALGLESVGVDDSFFDIGGHSLLVVQVHRRLVPLFPDLAVVDLFRYPTISTLAGYLSKEKVDQISLEQTRERAGERTDRARRQRDLRRQARGR